MHHSRAIQLICGPHKGTNVQEPVERGSIQEHVEYSRSSILACEACHAQAAPGGASGRGGHEQRARAVRRQRHLIPATYQLARHMCVSPGPWTAHLAARAGAAVMSSTPEKRGCSGAPSPAALAGTDPVRARQTG